MTKKAAKMKIKTLTTCTILNGGWSGMPTRRFYEFDVRAVITPSVVGDMLLGAYAKVKKNSASYVGGQPSMTPVSQGSTTYQCHFALDEASGQVAGGNSLRAEVYAEWRRNWTEGPSTSNASTVPQ